jgi:hypothetical protein
VLESGDGARLSLESADDRICTAALQCLGEQPFDRDIALKIAITPAADDGETAAPQFFTDLVAPGEGRDKF